MDHLELALVVALADQSNVYMEPPNIYNPSHFRNYDVDRWGSTYDTFLRCLEKQQASAACRIMDSFFPTDVEMMRTVSRSVNFHSSFEKFDDEIASFPLIPFVSIRDRYIGIDGTKYHLPHSDQLRYFNNATLITPTSDCFTIKPSDFVEEGQSLLREDNGILICELSSWHSSVIIRQPFENDE